MQYKFFAVEFTFACLVSHRRARKGGLNAGKREGEWLSGEELEGASLWEWLGVIHLASLEREWLASRNSWAARPFAHTNARLGVLTSHCFLQFLVLNVVVK